MNTLLEPNQNQRPDLSTLDNAALIKAFYEVSAEITECQKWQERLADEMRERGIDR